MTNDTRPLVAPVEGHYAMLRNGEISLNHIPYFRKNSPCAWECPTSGAKWLADGKSYNGRHLDIIAIISPEAMALVAEKSTYKAIVFGLRDRLARLEALIPLVDAVLDHADSHCRAFPIATFPRERWFEAWNKETNSWQSIYLWQDTGMGVPAPCFTHWREPLPPPTTPPLPAVFVELGAALEKIKGAG
jgi:hypothetical protein